MLSYCTIYRVCSLYTFTQEFSVDEKWENSWYAARNFCCILLHLLQYVWLFYLTFNRYTFSVYRKNLSCDFMWFRFRFTIDPFAIWKVNYNVQLWKQMDTFKQVILFECHSQCQSFVTRLFNWCWVQFDFPPNNIYTHLKYNTFFNGRTHFSPGVLY